MRIELRKKALKPLSPVAVGILILSVSCSTTTNRDLAESAVETFHSQFNSQLYDSIELAAADEFKKDGRAYLKKAHDLLGKVTSTNQVTGSVQNMADEAQISLVYLTDFANEQAPETFVYRVKDRRARLVFYEVAAKGLTKN
jgi:hypothetical protein